MLLLLLLKLERRRRQLPSPQLPGSYLAALSSSHYQCDMASLDCQFGHWNLNGWIRVCFLRCCFMCCHTLPPVGARRAWWFSCLPLRGSPRMGGWNGDLKGWRRARNKKIIDIQMKKNLVLWEGMEWDGPVKTYLVPWSLRLKGDPGERWQLFRTLGPPERPNSWVSTFFSENVSSLPWNTRRAKMAKWR